MSASSFPPPLSKRPSGDLLIRSRADVPRGWLDSVQNFRNSPTVDRVKEWQTGFFFPRTFRVLVPISSCKIFEPAAGG